MRNGIFAAVLALLGGSSLAWGQESSLTGLPITSFDNCACPCPPRIWGSAEYLMWWTMADKVRSGHSIQFDKWEDVEKFARKMTKPTVMPSPKSSLHSTKIRQHS